MNRDSTSAKPPSSRSVEDALRPHRKALAALLRTPALSLGDVDTALRELTEVAVEVLNVERASVWRFDPERSRIECMDLYEKKARTHTRGQTIARSDAPRYFAALEEERSINAMHAESDTRTSEFTESYLRPLNIGAMLDAPVFAGPMLIGVVCNEHVGGTRAWRLWEELVASTLADFVALVLATSERIASERLLDDHRKHLEQLVEDRTAKLRESEAELSKLFNASPVPMILIDAAEQRIVLANHRATTMLGPGQTGRSVTGLWVNPEDSERLLDHATSDAQHEPFVTELYRTSETGVHSRFFAEIAVDRVTHGGEDCVLLGIHDVTRQREAEAALRELATKDGLTGVYNRRRFTELAEQEFARAERYGKPVSVAMLDVDHFKAINDRHGHATGDAVLRLLASRLEREVRKIDIVARVGGEEFVIVFPETTRDAAERVALRLADVIRNEPYDSPGGPAHFTVSIGLIERARGESVDAAVDRADRAMYKAKAGGRDRLVLG